MKSICLFCSYFTSEEIPNYVQFYIKELTRHFTKVIFITNDKKLSANSSSFLENNHIELLFVQNEGYDFGMWYKGMLKYNIEQYDRVGLINDSCILFKPLDEYFSWLNGTNIDFSGMLDSTEVVYHIQSYFLIVNKNAIAEVLQFFNKHGYKNNRQEVIDVYELGLTGYLQNKNLRAEAWYKSNDFMPGDNASIYEVRAMIRKGFPLIKKKIIFSSFSNEEYRHIYKHKFNHNPQVYISQIQNSNGSGNLFDFKLLVSDGYKLNYSGIINHTINNFLIRLKGALVWRLKRVYHALKIRSLRDFLKYHYQKIKNKFGQSTNPETLKVAICLICKDENQYLDEWIGYYESIGIDYFFIYDNNSKIPIAETLKGRNNCTVIEWRDNVLGKQMRAYLDCCKKNQKYDWILFVDTDEFLILKKHNKIQEFLVNYNKFSAVGINWVCYVSSGFENRVEWDKYFKFIPLNDEINNHIKSIVNPKLIKHLPEDPHKFPIVTVNEHKNRITGPFSPHSSYIAYIRHNITRSKNEYIDKIKRGRGDGAPDWHTLETFKEIEKRAE